MAKQDNNSNEDETELNNGGLSAFCRPTSHIHEFYLSGVIDSPEKYSAVFAEIRQAPSQDTVYIHINSPGGNAFTAIQFLRVLFETQATTVASIEGMCSSAATMIFLACQHHEITNFSIFMIHNFSAVSMGKGHEIYQNAVHTKDWSEDLMNKMYKDFLTENEIKEVLEGKDLYLTGDQVNARINKRNGIFDKMRKEHQKAEKAKIPKITKRPKAVDKQA